MANTLYCDIVTPEKMLFHGEAVLVSAPAAEGEIGFMYQCAPLMSTLRRGTVRLKSESDETTTFAVDGGYVEADGVKVVVLASHAIDVAEIDPAVSNERIAKAKQRIAQLPEDDSAITFLNTEITWQEYLVSLASN